MLLVLCAGIVACVPEDSGLEDRPCPCVQGYVCVDDICVVDDGTLVESDAATSDVMTADVGDDAGSDSGFDATSVPDARLSDSGPDVPNDAGMDAANDVGVDGGRDVGPDVPAIDAGPTLSFCDRHGAGADLCLDFDEDLGAGWTEVETGGGDVRFDSSRAVSGRSLRLTAAALAHARYEGADVANVSSGKVWIRMRVFVEPGGEDNAYFPILSLSQRRTEPYAYFGIAFAGGPGRIRTALSRGALGFEDATSEFGSFRAGEWFCLETEFDVSVDTPVLTYINGAEVSRFRAATVGTFDRIHVGVDEAGMGQSARTVWVDDVVWSATRVGCGLE